MNYASLAQLRRAASSIAMLQPTGVTTVLNVSGLPFTIARVSVLKILAGEHLPAKISLRQTGSAEAVPGEGCAPLVLRGHIYLAYLIPVRLSLNGPGVHSQYFVVGGSQGLFDNAAGMVPADPSKRAFTRVDPSSTITIPHRVSITELSRS